MLLLNLLLAIIVGVSVFLGVGIITGWWYWIPLVTAGGITFVAGILYDVISQGLIEWSNRTPS
jgi:MFS superfamily sulfate permease-like transporter